MSAEVQPDPSAYPGPRVPDAVRSRRPAEIVTPEESPEGRTLDDDLLPFEDDDYDAEDDYDAQDDWGGRRDEPGPERDDPGTARAGRDGRPADEAPPVAGARPGTEPWTTSGARSTAPPRGRARPVTRRNGSQLPAPPPVRGRPVLPLGLIAAALVFVGLFVVCMGAGAMTGFDIRDVFKGPDEPPPRSFPVLEPSRPTKVSIPALDIEAPILDVGLAADGSVAVPPLDRHNEAGWFEQGPTPGQFGPALIVGHADTRTGPSVFHGLGRLKPGQEIRVKREDGDTAVFKVNSVEHFGKQKLPIKRVYGDYSRPSLRLVTCGGTWLGGRQGYSDNIIVFASLVDAALTHRHATRRAATYKKAERALYAASATSVTGAGRSSQSAQRGSGVRWPRTRQATPRGAAGAVCSRHPSSAGVLSPLLWLHLAHAATTLSQAWRPPRLRGKTWSMVSAEPRQ